MKIRNLFIIFFIVQSLNASLYVNVGNNLVLESLRDEYSSSHKGFNVNVGGSSSSVNGEKLMKYGVTPSDIKYNDVFNDFSPKR